jgi:major membrane immunogen (membrane-anchored lipoprotein)
MSYTATNMPAYNGYPRMGMHTQDKTGWKQRLDQEVADGQLTSAQEQMIETKYQSMRQSWGSMKDESSTQRRAEMQQMKQQMMSWAQSEGIPSQYVTR